VSSTSRTARPAGYVAQLQAYDQAFATFFDRLTADGITKDNTLFVVTVEEGDHFAGAAPTPAGCDGVTTPCNYSLLGRDQRQPRRSARHATGDHDTVHRPLGHGANCVHHGNPARSPP
jgi:hypothetical protein